MPAKLQLLAPDEQMLNPAYSAEAFDNYDPSFSQINEARYSQFYITDDVVLAGMHNEARQLDSDNSFISEEQFKSSPNYREGMQYGTGITERSLEIQARRQDAAQYDNYVLERAKGVKNVFASALGFTEATALDPINLAATLLPVPGLREATALKSMALQGAFGAAKAGAIKGAVQGAVGSLYFEPLLAASAWEFGEEYTLANTAQNVLTNAIFGGAIHGTGSGLKAKFTAKEIPVEQAIEAISKTTFEMHHDLIPDNEIILKQGEVIKRERVVAAEVRSLEQTPEKAMTVLEKEYDMPTTTPERKAEILAEMDSLAERAIATTPEAPKPSERKIAAETQMAKLEREYDSPDTAPERQVAIKQEMDTLAEERIAELNKANDEIKLGVQEKLKSKQQELKQINERKQEIAARQREIESQPAEKVMERDYVLGDLYNKVPDEPQFDFDVVKKTEEARAVIDSMAGSEYIPPETKQRLAEEFTQLNTEQVSLSKAIEMAAFCFLKGGK